ncbi:MAG TPA: hypothetical protein VLF14_11695 [Candidatus Binatia bacterium]|nr:hypothetical protein [Candidatus Binatia bacterium]
MRRSLVKSLVGAALLAGCSTSPPQATSETPHTYTNRELHASFHVPAGWTELKPWSPFQKAPYVARFDSPGGQDALILGQAAYAGTNCPGVASEALRASSGAAFASERQFMLKTARGEVFAGRGETSIGDRAGEARYFCYGETAVVFEASTSREQFAKRRAEIEAIADSFAVDVYGEQVAVRAPAEPPPMSTFFVYAVKFRGQTLGQIAEWYTGSSDNWRKIARVNSDLPLPNVPLKIGTEVKIPKEMLVRQDPPREPKRKRAVPTTPAGHAEPSAEKVAPAEPREAPEPEEAPALPPVIGPR